MIRRGKDNVIQTSGENVHGGVGVVKCRQLLGFDSTLDMPGHPEDFDSAIEFFHETILTPGSSIGLHTHSGNEEIYYVVEGRGLMTINGETAEMGPGDACLTKDGDSHTFKNIGDGDLKIVVVAAKLPSCKK